MRVRFVVAACLAAGLIPLAASHAIGQERSPGDEFAIAIERGDLDKVKSLVEGGAKPDTPIEYGEHKMTPLMKAVWEGEEEIVKFLLDAGADVNAKDTDNGQPPLMYAIARDRAGLVELLIQRGAKVNVRDVRKFTPAHMAAASGNVAILDALAEAGADLKAEMYGLTPLMMAASSRKAEAVRELVRLGAPVNQASKTMGAGRTVIFSAILAGDAAMVKLLIELKANVNLRARDGDTPLKAARKGDQEEIIRILKAAGAK